MESKKFKNWFRKVDFLIPIVVGALLVWWISVLRSPYFGYFIIPLTALLATKARWKYTRETEECVEEKIKIDNEEKEVKKTKGSSLTYRLEGGSCIREMLVILILFILYLLVISMLNNQYLNALICLGIEFYLISSLLFFMIKKERDKHWKPTIIGLSLTTIYFAIIFLIFH